MRKFTFHANSLYQQILTEWRLFWRSQETIFLTFLVPMMAMAMFIYLSQEGMLVSVFDVLFRGLGAEGIEASRYSPIIFMTLGMISYCAIAATFESPLPKLVKERDRGILKRLGGTPLHKGTYLLAKAGCASTLAFAEVLLILVVGLVSKAFTVEGNWWDLAILLLLGTFMLSGFAFVLSSLTKTFDSAIVVVHGVYIPMLLLSGAFVPVEALPGALKMIANLLPLTYFVTPFRGVLVDGAHLMVHLGEVVILLLWTIGGWALAIKTFRWH
jgi:ABC-2 type transport system permease protein